jgi:uncharacterized RDD family membrane protein YckC
VSYIGLGRRFVAWLIDVLITGLAWVPFADIDSDNGVYSISWRGMDFAVPVLITFVYFVLLEGVAGATIGKFVLGIRVRGADGSRIGVGAAAVRNLARAVDAFPYVIPYLVGAIAVRSSDTKQRLGDRWAKTVVILVGTDANASGEVSEPLATAALDESGLPSPPPGEPPADEAGLLPPPPP